MVLAAALPLLILTATTMRQQLTEKREIIEGSMQGIAAALTLAIDGEVKASRAVLETLGSSPLLDTGDIKTFYSRCVRAMEGRKGAFIILFDASGRPLLNSSRPFGSALPNPLEVAQPPGFDPRFRDVPMGGAANVKRVLATGQPVVSDLFVSLVTQEPRVAIDIPVMREGTLRYILELSLDAAEFSRLLADQRSPDSSVVSIVDRKGIAIASSISTRSNVGQPLPPELAAQLAKGGSGTGTGRDAQGEAVYHVFIESPLTGWKTSLSVARAAAYAPLSSAMTALAIGVVAAILVAVVAALTFGMRVLRLAGRSAPEPRAPRASARESA